MSGPKLIGITCDPEIIARNNARLREIGKMAYYSDIFAGLNTDIGNTQKWVENYGITTLKSLRMNDEIDSEELSDAFQKLDEFKKKAIQKMEKEKLEFGVINKKNTDELNQISCDMVRAIPKWKESFVREVSVYMRKLQEAYDVYQKKEKEIRKKIASLNAEMDKVDLQIRSIYKYEDAALVDTIEAIGQYTEVINDVVKNKKVKPEQETAEQTYTLEELAVIEMLNNELAEFEKTTKLSYGVEKLIRKMKKSLESLSDEINYTMKSRKNILYLMLGDYQRITKQIAQLNYERQTRYRFRQSLELEYVSFCDALDIKKMNYNDFTDEELESKVNTLREKVKKQEERIYIEESLTDIMEQFHYKGISAMHLHDSDKTSQIVFANSDEHLINSFFGDGAVMLQVVGEGDKSPTGAEIEEQVEEQGAFCTLYPQIKKELEKRKIHIDTENCAPISEDSTVNIVIERQTDIRTTTRKYSIVQRKLQSKNEAVEELSENKHLTMEA